MWGIPALLFLIAFFHRVAPGVIAMTLLFRETGGRNIHDALRR
jgi:hypothetical protein